MTDSEKHIALVKKIQEEVLKQYSLSYLYATQQATGLRNARLRNWEENPLTGQNYRADVWFVS